MSDGYFKYAGEVLKHPELTAQVDKGEITPKQAYDALRLRITSQREVKEVAEAQKFLPPQKTKDGLNRVICADVLKGSKKIADATVVPLPANGSSTTSPGAVRRRITRSASFSGNGHR